MPRSRPVSPMLPFPLDPPAVSVRRAATASARAGRSGDAAWRSSDEERALIAAADTPTPVELDRWVSHPDTRCLGWMAARGFERRMVRRTQDPPRYDEWCARPGRVWTHTLDALAAGTGWGSLPRDYDVPLVAWLAQDATVPAVHTLLDTFGHFRVRSAVAQHARSFDEALVRRLGSDIRVARFLAENPALPASSVPVLRDLAEAAAGTSTTDGGDPHGVTHGVAIGVLATLARRYPPSGAMAALVRTLRADRQRGHAPTHVFRMLGSVVTTPEDFEALRGCYPRHEAWLAALVREPRAPTDLVVRVAGHANPRWTELALALRDRPEWATDPTVRAPFLRSRAAVVVASVLAVATGEEQQAAFRQLARLAPLQALEYLEQAPAADTLRLTDEDVLPLLTAPKGSVRTRAQLALGLLTRDGDVFRRERASGTPAHAPGAMATAAPPRGRHDRPGGV